MPAERLNAALMKRTGDSEFGVPLEIIYLINNLKAGGVNYAKLASLASSATPGERNLAWDAEEHRNIVVNCFIVLRAPFSRHSARIRTRTREAPRNEEVTDL